MRLEEVRARVETAHPLLEGRVESAVQFTALLARNQLPQVTPAAFVLPGRLSGGAPDAVAGLYRQGFEEGATVVIVVRYASDAQGDAAMVEIDPIIDAVVRRICGWAPDDAIGEFRLGAGTPLSMMAGGYAYQIEFILQDQLRIST